AVWLLFAIFWSMISPLVAGALAPVDPLDPMTAVHQLELEKSISRLSPNTLYGEMTLALLSPETRTLGLVFMSQLRGALMGAPLPGLVAAMVLVFTIAYVAFQRQEVRA